jgi:predicted transglutaminase-like cysteine proteinase
MRRLLVALALVVALGQTTLPVTANVGPGGAATLQTGGSFNAPIGFQIFCLTNASQCRGGGSSAVALTEDVLNTLELTNRHVNRAIRPTADRGDVWELGVTRGDCEDYVLAKRAELIRAGIPGAALRIAAAKTSGGVGHAVLIVRTDQGDLVLDNLTSTIKFVNQSNLRWVAMTTANGRAWQRIG